MREKKSKHLITFKENNHFPKASTFNNAPAALSDSEEHLLSLEVVHFEFSHIKCLKSRILFVLDKREVPHV